MRVCVSHVYWMLLLTSVVSSALLFLIVASENIQHSKIIGPDKNKAVDQEENVSFIKNSQEKSDSSDSETKSKIEVSSSLKSKPKDQSVEDFQDPISASFDIANKNEESKISDEIEILKESLNQQPNLSQGVSDGGQAVVLTLVQDAATNTLQSLATGRSEFRPKGAEGNASVGPKDDSLLRISKIFGVSSSPNDSFYEDDPVVVVRAEQRNVKDEADKKEEEGIAKDEQLDDKITQTTTVDDHETISNPQAASDLNDSEARARITNGAGEDSTVAILDSLVTAGPSEPAHEDIPSFNEWAQKRLEEAEKKKTHSNASVQTANGSPGRSVSNMRMRSKNYASPDCGAKIVAANPESRSARSILVSTRDEYMLNTCGSRIWFIVELCEAIQAKKIDLANFELFSSSPKDLSVYVSDRYPTREWSNVGQFTARDERDVQSFSLQPQIFGKFIKVELSSHYGSEHFCPISLFRAYGTSEFEVLETETEHLDVDLAKETSANGNIAAGSDFEGEDDEDEDSIFNDEEENRGEPPVHLFGSARDAVLSLVKKAAEVLIKSADLKSTNNITKIQESIKGDVLEDTTLDDCVTPMYSVACRDCDDNRFARVFQLISCKGHYLESLLSTKFVQETLSKSLLCGSSFEFNFMFDSDACSDGLRALNDINKDISSYYLQAHFLSSLFTPDYIIALCNVLAAREQRLFANVSHQEQQRLAEGTTPNKTRAESTSSLVTLIKTTKDENVTPTQVTRVRSSDTVKAKAEVPVIKSKLEFATDSQVISESLITQIKPTKTTSLKEEQKKQPPPTNLESSRSVGSDDTPHQSETLTSDASSASVATKTASQRIVSGSKEQVQDGNPKKDVSTSGTVSKAPASADSLQKPSEKSIGSDSGAEMKTKGAEEKEEKAKVESAEPETKTQLHQDQNLNLEFDFKDLDVDSLQSNGGKGDAFITQQTASATTPQQKESVFLRLSNRIKVLERNMSLSSQYLEELSKRYKKQVEEMQRSLERAMTAMTEASRKSEERELKRLEESNTLRIQIDTLKQVLDDLVYERSSWRISLSSLFQHAVFVFVDVVLVVLIFSYCRRTDDDLDYYDEEEVPQRRRVIIKPRIGKTYEMVKQSCNQLTKKPKKRRPSEIASQVSGTYDQLMIENTAHSSQLSKKDRRKKRKKDSTVHRSTSTKESNSVGKGTLSLKVPPMHSRSASASDAYYHGNANESLPNLELQKHSRPESAPDNSIEYFAEQSKQQHPRFDKKVQILATTECEKLTVNEATASSREDLNVSVDDDTLGQDGSSSRIHTQPTVLSVPPFMKTALGSRSKRISFSGRKVSQNYGENKIDSEVESFSELETVHASGDDGNVDNALLTPTNGHHVVDESEDDSRCSSATPTSWSSKKDKKTSGLKRAVRKFLRLN